MIEKAIDLLRDTPLEALSLRKLAREAGVSHNAPYMHFPDKTALVSAVSDRGFAKLTQELRAARDLEEDWTRAVVAVGQAYVRFLLTHAPLAEVMFRPRPLSAAGEVPAQGGNSGAADSPGPSAAGLAMFNELVAVIEAGRVNGHLMATGDPRGQALHLWTVLHGAAAVMRATRADPVDVRGRPVDAQVEEYVRIAIRGLAP